MSNPAKTIRKLLEQLADAVEALTNRTNNQAQATIGMAELSLSERLDDLEARIAALELQSKAVGDDAAG